MDFSEYLRKMDDLNREHELIVQAQERNRKYWKALLDSPKRPDRYLRIGYYISTSQRLREERKRAFRAWMDMHAEYSERYIQHLKSQN